ncbi:MAG TPA: Hsp70 family protein, partial [Chloroflexota bacterium]
YTLTPAQDSARVRVYQGEEPVASRNTLLGEFLFAGISPAPPGLNREVVVRFDYDLDGIVQVSATDRRTNRSERITMTTTRERLGEAEKAASKEKLAAVDRRLEREITALLRRAERAMTRLEADGQSTLAEEVLALGGDLERARQRRDYDQARVLVVALGELLYGGEE